MNRNKILLLRVLTAIGMLAAWHLLTTVPAPEKPLLDPFFFSTPVEVLHRTAGDIVTYQMWYDLYITLLETALAFSIGVVSGIALGFWFARRELLAAVMDPYVQAANALPRVVLAPIFALWFGLGIWSKVALGVTLVFFIVFFNVYQGVREVSPNILANARMLGANRRQLLSAIYLPSAMSWVFASLHNAVGLAFVGAVVGEYLGSARGVGYLILQAETTFDINTVFAGIFVLTAFALLLDAVVGVIERRLMTWQPRAAETERT